MHCKHSKWGTLVLALGCAVATLACPIRTEHKVETTHKIEAHIVIDVRKVQEQAEQIETEVRGEPTPKAKPDPGDHTDARVAHPDGPYALASPPRTFWTVFDISTPARAAQNDGENAAVERRKARAGRINEELNRGCLGENNRGYVELRPCDAAEASQRAAIRALADDENRDRRTIYGAIAVRQGLRADQADVIGEIFSASIRKRLSAGQSFQVPSSDDHYEEFLKTDLGRTLGKPRPGSWVRVP